VTGTEDLSRDKTLERAATSQVAALIAIGRIGTRSVLAFRSEVIVGAVALLVRVVLVTLVWRAVYGDRTAVAGITRDYAVAYAVLAAVLGNIMNPWQFSNLQTRIKQGRVAIDLLRPIGLIPQTMAQQIGITISALPRAILAVGLGVLIGALALPDAGPLGVVAFAVSALAGVVIALLANLIVAMTAFWTTEIGGALMIYRAVAQFASGALIPLWFMPHWLRACLEWLPFQAQIFVPLSIYFGRTSGWDVVGSIAGQLAWIAGLALIAELVWLRALRRVVVLGG
jgi:ABC-type uncharacterized transport system permease subunit